ncbi:MAG TPA: SDR family oxidoreductase [Arsenicitalea sp.]|jgi:NAD(P)-dependent dehydrogenase (short-subunit alcohol dehydrogenase family)|nr:SDR family oxidoreductase [Arsenicitalea sp.]
MTTPHWAAPFFTGKSVLISGGSSGIGLGIAHGFAAAGANVLATGATDAEVDTAAAQNPAIAFAKLDVRDNAAVKALVADLPSLDVLVNCAGIIRRNDELDPETFDTVVDINLNGSMRLCAACRPLLAQSHGAILNTASMLSFFGGGLVPGYSASKGGIAQLTKSLAIAYAAQDIRVNALAPGWIETPLTAGLREDPARSAAILSRTPMARWGRPDDLVGAALFLTSPLAGFITGAVLPVDGGYLVS